MTTLGTTTGTVTGFDDPEGWGVVTAEDGSEHFFHCSAIADGTRFIEVGTNVTFEVVAGSRGRWEAASIVATRSPRARKGGSRSRR